jgi:hypothetical protein
MIDVGCRKILVLYFGEIKRVTTTILGKELEKDLIAKMLKIYEDIVERRVVYDALS